MGLIWIKRVYEEASADDGKRVLVDRIWPRGISKERARIDVWMKEIAPTTELRQWFNHEPTRYEEFKRRYVQQLLENDEQMGRLKQIHSWAQMDTVTLLYAAKDIEHNQAVVLMEILNNDIV